MIFSVEETKIGNYFKINYKLARQLMMIFDTFNQRILDASPSELDETIIEIPHHFDNKVTYEYFDMPMGWRYYVSQTERQSSYVEFINWFFKNRQQPIDYLIKGVMKHKSEKRMPIKADHTSTSTAYASSEYGGVPIVMEDSKGNVEANFARRF